MSEDFIQVNVPVTLGKKLKTYTSLEGAEVVHSEAVTLTDTDGNAILPLTDDELRASPVPVTMPLPSGAATEATLTAIYARQADGTQVVTDGGGSITVDGPLTDAELRASAVPISASTLPLPSGAATEATLLAVEADTSNLDVALSTRASEATLLGVKSGTDNLDVALSTRASETTLATRASEATLLAVEADTSNLDVLLSTRASEATLGLIKVKTDNLDVSLSTRATEATLGLIKAKTDNLDVALSTRLAEATFTSRINTLGQKTMANSTPIVIASDQSDVGVKQATAANLNAQVQGVAADGAAVSGNPVLIGGSDGTNAQTIKTDTSGDVYVVVEGAPSNATRGLAFGRVLGSSGTLQAILATTYTEQTANAQRSMSSSSASDTSAGTGARQVKITYYTATMTGPFTETITMNGVTTVNTVATDICYIEKMEVISVGSNGSNVGTITLFAAAAAAGGAVGTIAINTLVSGRGDNMTLWAHHYVATGKSCHVKSLSGGTNQNQGGQIFLMARDPTVSTSPNKPVTDSVAMASSTTSIVRAFQVPIVVTGPATIVAYLIPLGSNTNFYAGFDFWEI